MSEVRPIDANALWEFMRTYDDYQGAKEAHDVELIHRDSILFAIETAPTVDAVPVVRCNDCDHMKWKRSIYTDGTINRCRRCELDNKEHPNDWFCADGKRRNE